MSKKLCLLMLLALLVGTLNLASRVEKVEASGTIYIMADGSINPPDAPISISDKITYTLTDNVNGSIVVERDNIVIDGNGHTIQGTGTGTGLDLSGRSNVTIKNMEIQEFGEGIRMLDSSNSSIIENSFWNDGERGIWLYGSSNNSVSRNNIANNDYGIWLEYSSNNNRIIGNNVTANTYDGILLDYSSDNNDIRENNLEKNFPGIMIDHSSKTSIAGNNVTNNHDGIRLFYSSNNSIIGNNVTANEFYGIKLEGPSSNNVLRNNSMARNGYSFGVWGYELADFINDVDTSNTVDEKPIYYLVNVQNLTISPQAYPDIGYLAVVNSTNITVRDLNIKDNDQGVLLACTRDSSIENFTATNNSAGLLLVCSSNNTIARNNIINDYWGIVLWESSYNSISGNNFINNWLQASVTTGYTNFWDNGYPSGGNYWSDYTGVDLHSSPNQTVTGSDSIGDTPYAIDGSNVDIYPLMAPYSRFEAGTWNGASYDVDFVSNPTISDFHFDSQEGPFLKFSVTGQDGTSGFCRVTIPKDLLWVEDGWTVLYGSYPLSYETFSDENYTYLYFTYTNPSYNGFTTVTINGTNVIPEFPPFLILPLFMIATLLAVIVYRKKHARISGSP